MLIYVLMLENNKFYIGKTSNLEKRFNAHINGNGSQFTKKYKPINIHKVYKELSEFDEDNYTKKYMKLFGINNVRGGTYCNINLNTHQMNLLKKELNTIKNECYKCGRNTHYINDCYAKIHIDGHVLNNVDQITTCYKCGRNNHCSNDCYAKTHINGDIINDNNIIMQFENLTVQDAIDNTISIAKSIYRYFKYKN